MGILEFDKRNALIGDVDERIAAAEQRLLEKVAEGLMLVSPPTLTGEVVE